MSATISSIQIQPVDFSDSALSFLDGNVGNRYKAIITGYVSKFTQQKRVTLSGNTLTNANPLDNESFLNLIYDGNPFLPGENVKIQGSTLNTGSLTIASVTSTVITFTTSLTTETIEVGYIYVVSKPTAIDYYFNLIGNSEPLSFMSKTDNVLQRYTATGFDPSVSTPINFTIGTSSFAWVTDILTGNVSTSTLAGGTITGVGQTYQQPFTITHYFTQIPMFLPNMSFPNPPSWYKSTSLSSGIIQQGALQYICLVACKYNSTDSTAQNWGTVYNSNGTSCWLNQNNAGTVPDFTLVSTTYVDNATSLPLTAIDFTKTNNVTIIINSASGAFTSGTKIDLAHWYFPLNAADYQNTPTTALQNYMNDRKAVVVGAGAVNGLFYGTNYSVIQNLQAVLNSANQITITFKAIYASSLQTYLIARPGNRNYGFTIATE